MTPLKEPLRHLAGGAKRGVQDLQGEEVGSVSGEEHCGFCYHSHVLLVVRLAAL